LTERTDAPVRERSSQAARKYSQTFPAYADQISQARAFLRRALAGCAMAEDAVLICSELATNAVLFFLLSSRVVINALSIGR
jgi:hypothetical protein